jgi:hypothetical protein
VSTTDAHRRAARAYQERHVAIEKCMRCAAPALIRTLIDPITGDFVLVKRMTFCLVHWHANSAERARQRAKAAGVFAPPHRAEEPSP